MLDAQRASTVIADRIKHYVAQALAPLVSRLVAVEAREPKDGADGLDGAPGKDGRDGLPGLPGRDGAEGRVGEPGRDGKDGRDGAPGLLPAVKEWTNGVHYAGVVVTHQGSAYQAQHDTGNEPPHADWLCIASGGRDGKDGRSPNVRGTWSADIKDYVALDVVALGGAGFMARRDNPGPCPGDGWQLIASQGKRGNQGERGVQGPRGPAGPAVISMSVDDQGLLTIVNADGSRVECDLYPLLIKVQR